MPVQEDFSTIVKLSIGSKGVVQQLGLITGLVVDLAIMDERWNGRGLTAVSH